MAKLPSRLVLPFAGLVALFQIACGDATGPGDQANDRIAIVNDPSVLAARVTYYDAEILIDDTGVGYPPGLGPVATASQPASAGRFSLKLKAEIAPPSIGGQVLQATSVAIAGDRGVVSYSMRGAEYLGAIDVVDLSNANKPKLVSQALFRNSDVHAVSLSGQTVLVAGATLDTGAVFEVMQLQGNSLVLGGNRRLVLTSYVGTSAASSATRAYATSGDDGALFAIDPLSLAVVASTPLRDARWVAVGGGSLVVVQGTPGRIAVFDEGTFAAVGQFPFAGADIPESKSTVELVGGKAFIAAGSGGVQVLSARTGAVVGSVPRPDPGSLGLDPSVVVTNAASVDRDLLFISNGEAGVYVAQGAQPFSATGSEVAQQISVLGRLQFGNLQSANHVAYRSDRLMVAAGLGGLKIVKVN